ncbi:hypothetical protein KSP39_PZI003093 [Platanthera zijinensis]|uniref:Uncharacterized protein n=1 Tax=Platanthera zijinensis TaxID=2320716 RepID=A0AAP0GCC2_9ASPA
MSRVNFQASYHALKINVEKSCTSLCRTDERLQEVENYMLLSDVHILQSYFLQPSNLRKFHCILDLLSNRTLGLLANLITKKVNSERRRPKIKKVIKDHVPDTLSASNARELVTTLQLLSEFLIDPRKFHEKQPKFPILDCSSTLTPVFKALESLDRMPILALCALNKKLRGKKVVPRFPPSKIGYNKKLFANKIREHCRGLIFDNGNSMPKELSKALSVIDLFLKYKTKCHDTLTSKFLSYSKDKVIVQKDILQALWSLPKVTSYQLKHLQSIMGLKLEYNSNNFQNHLKQYLMQYLFECDEIDIPSDVYDILAILNQSSCSRTQKCSNEINEGEAEAVLNVSAELMEIVLHLKSYASCDDMAAEELESDDDAQANDFQLVESYYCSNPVKYQQQQIDGELETTGDSMSGTNSTSATNDNYSDVLSEAPKSTEHGCVKKLKEEQDNNIHDINHHYMESMKMFPRSSTRATKDFRDISFKELCDETSLVSYRLIDHMLNSFLLVEGLDADDRDTDHLTGPVSSSKSFQGTKEFRALS